jgi:phage terminase large subunit-like protein
MTLTKGPKPGLSGPPLDLSALPEAGGPRASAFIERYVRTPKGTGARQPLRLRPWQRGLIGGLLDDPRPRRGTISIPAGNGKSTLAAALGLYGILGDGVEGAQVPIVASDKRQAGIIQRIARRMVELDPELAEQVIIYFDYLYVPRTDSTLQALPAELEALQGWDPSLAIVDELHVVTRDVYESLEARAGKRERSLLLAISTPPRTGDTDTVMWDLVETGRAGTDPSMFFREYAAPLGCDLDDEAAWHQANPALGDFLHIDALRANRTTMRETTFRAWRLGQWPGISDDAWLPDGAWDACMHRGRVTNDLPHVLAFDGSFSGDATVLVSATIEDRPHLELLACWEPPEGARDYRVPVLEVEDKIREVCRTRKVREVVADPYRWNRSLQILEAEGLPIVEFPQSPQRMTPATTGLYEAIMNQAVTQDGDPRLARHVANAVLRQDARGARITKDHKDSKRRIDGAVCAIMAHARARTLATKRGMQIFV